MLSPPISRYIICLTSFLFPLSMARRRKMPYATDTLKIRMPTTEKKLLEENNATLPFSFPHLLALTLHVQKTGPVLVPCRPRIGSWKEKGRILAPRSTEALRKPLQDTRERTRQCGVMLHSRLLQTKFLRFRSSRQRHNTEVAELSGADYSKSVPDVQSPTMGKSAAAAFLPAQCARSLVPLSHTNRARRNLTIETTGDCRDHEKAALCRRRDDVKT